MADQFPEIILISALIPAFLTARLEFAVLYRMVPTMWNFMEVKKVSALGTWVPGGFAASYASLTKKLNPSSSPPHPLPLPHPTITEARIEGNEYSSHDVIIKFSSTFTFAKFTHPRYELNIIVIC